MLQDLGSWPARRWQRTILVAAVLAVVLYIVVRAWNVLVPFGLGLLLAYIILPLIDGLQARLVGLVGRERVARAIAVAIVYLLALAAIAAFFYLFVPVVITQVERLIEQREAILRGLQPFASAVQRFIASLPGSVQTFIVEQFAAASARVQAQLPQTIISGATALVTSLGTLAGFIIVPIWLIYVLLDSGRLSGGLAGLIPEGAYGDLSSIGRLFDDSVGAFVRGQLLVAAIDGVLAAVALSLLGVDFAILLGVVTAIGDLIPTLGPILAIIPAVIIAALQRPILALWALLTLLAIEQFENLVLGPRIVGESVRVRPALIIVLLVVAGYLAGLLGLLLVVPLFAFSRDLVRYLYLRTAEPEVQPSEALRRVRKARRGD